MADLNDRLADLDKRGNALALAAERITGARRLLLVASRLDAGRDVPVEVCRVMTRIHGTGAKPTMTLTGGVVDRLHAAIAAVLRDEAERLLTEVPDAR